MTIACRYSLDGTQPEFDFFPSALLLADWLSATEFLFAASCLSVVGFLTAFRILHEVCLSLRVVSDSHLLTYLYNFFRRSALIQR